MNDQIRIFHIYYGKNVFHCEEDYMNDSTKGEFLNIDELCAKLKVKKQFVRKLTHQRKIPFRKIGRMVRYYWPDINKWILTQSKKEGGLWQA